MINQQPQTLLQGKPWVNSKHTDVQATWRKFGWTPTHPLPAHGVDTPVVMCKRCTTQPQPV